MRCEHLEPTWDRDGKECRKCGLSWHLVLKENRQNKPMTAKEARHKAEQAFLRIKRQKEAQARIDAEERERERIEAEKALEQEANARLPEAIAKIEESVEFGGTATTINYGRNGELSRAIKIKLQKLGYIVHDDDKFWDADSGDKDSGEGACDAHWSYNLVVSWEKA